MYLSHGGGVLSFGGKAHHLRNILRGRLDVNQRYEIVFVGQQRAALVGRRHHRSVALRLLSILSVVVVLILVAQGDGGGQVAAILFGLVLLVGGISTGSAVGCRVDCPVAGGKSLKKVEKYIA